MRPKTLMSLFATLLLCTFSSCTETEKSLDELDPPSLKLSTKSLSFEADGTPSDDNNGTVTITTNRDWNVNANRLEILTSWGWSIDHKSGSGDGSFTITPSVTLEARTAKFTVSIKTDDGERITEDVNVTQDGMFLTTSLDNENPTHFPQAVTLAIESSDAWSVTSDKSWAKPSQASGEAAEFAPKRISIDLEANDGEEREATIIIKTKNLEKSLTLKQAGYRDAVVGVEESMSGYGLINSEVSILTDQKWTISSNQPWITFSEEEGDANTAQPTIIKLNSEINFYSDRSAVVTFSAGKDVKTINISQPKYTRPVTKYRVGDAGIKFDESQFDPEYKYNDKMMIWRTAGREGGIPLLADQLAKVTKTFGPGTSSKEINDYFYENRNQAVVVFLKNGEYTFDSSVRLYNNATLIGESRGGVKITVDPAIGAASPISMYGATNAGVRNLWLHGGWLNADGNNYPKYSFAEGGRTELTAEGMGGHAMINIKASSSTGISNCFVDNVRVTNSASHPVVLGGQHITVRDMDIDGAFNKGGGCQGYMFLGGSRCLITGCTITNIRHVSMQNPVSTENVFYDNDLVQEFSFHVNDGGNNLIEYNRIYLSPELTPSYNAIMGPWSSAHTVGGLNFIYNNRCKEDNGTRGGKTPWSDDRLYLGPHVVSIGTDNPTRYTNFAPIDSSDFPKGGTLYPVLVD